MLESLIGLFIFFVIVGVIVWLLNRAPIIPAEFKSLITYFGLAVCVIGGLVWLVRLLGREGWAAW